MKINADKTKVALFNTARKYDFMPQLSTNQNTNLEVVENFRLLGIQFQTNMGWQSNTNHMCKNAYSRIWMLRRLRRLGASHADMLDVYYKQIRCVLEMAVAVWTPGITKAESVQIERVQKCALHVILGENYQSYTQAIFTLGVEKLSQRRFRLSLNFARRCEKNQKYANWFKLSENSIPPNRNTRGGMNTKLTKYTPVPYRTERYQKSPLPFLTNLLNEYHMKKK